MSMILALAEASNKNQTKGPLNAKINLEDNPAAQTIDLTKTKVSRFVKFVNYYQKKYHIIKQ